MDAVLRYLGFRPTEAAQVPPIHGDYADQPPFKWKFIDASTFIHQGILKFVHVDDFHQLEFVAISYTWSRNMLKWREWILSIGPEEKVNQVPSDTGASGDMKRFHCFFTVVSFLVLTRGKLFFWLDVLCIDQDNQEEKAYFVPKMGSLYAASTETHLYITGSVFVAPLSEELHFPIWETRAWTLQEYILSKEVIFCYCFSGNVMEDIRKIRKTAAQLPTRTTKLRSPLLERYTSSTADNAYVLEMGAFKVTCCFDEDHWFGPQLSTGSYMRSQEIWPNINKIIGRSTLSKCLWTIRQEHSRERIISTSMALLGGRASTQPEDMMYCVLGVLEMEDYQVHYGIGFEEARIRVFEGMKADVLGTVLGTDWGSLQVTKDNDSALPRIVGSEPTIGVVRIKTTNSSKYTREIGTVITSRKETFRMWKDLSRSPTRSVGTVRAGLGSMTSRLLCHVLCYLVRRV